jgi:hypothetical protein
MLAYAALLAGYAYMTQSGGVLSEGASRPPLLAALELCPAVDFKASLTELLPLRPGVVEQFGGVDRVTEDYMRLFGAGVCPVSASGTNGHMEGGIGWPRSSRTDSGLLINAGEGSTGTRDVDCIFQHLGLEGGHYLSGGKAFGCSTSQPGSDCTKLFDRFDYVSDSPVSAIVPQLLASHPGHLLSGALLSLREPFEWAQRRAEHNKVGAAGRSDDVVKAETPCGCHAHAHHYGMLAAVGCNGSPSLSDVNASALAVVIHDAWATCLITKRFRQPLLALNVFNGVSRIYDGGAWSLGSEDGFVEALFRFLDSHSRTKLKGRLSLEQVRAATEACVNFSSSS